MVENSVSNIVDTCDTILYKIFHHTYPVGVGELLQVPQDSQTPRALPTTDIPPRMSSFLHQKLDKRLGAFIFLVCVTRRRVLCRLVPP